jgi:hypothetical protein
LSVAQSPTWARPRPRDRVAALQPIDSSAQWPSGHFRLQCRQPTWLPLLCEGPEAALLLTSPLQVEKLARFCPFAAEADTAGECPVRRAPSWLLAAAAPSHTPESFCPGNRPGGLLSSPGNGIRHRADATSSEKLHLARVFLSFTGPSCASLPSPSHSRAGTPTGPLPPP